MSHKKQGQLKSIKSVDLVMRSCLVGILLSRLQAILGVFPEGMLKDKNMLLYILSQILKPVLCSPMAVGLSENDWSSPVNSSPAADCVSELHFLGRNYGCANPVLEKSNRVTDWLPKCIVLPKYLH